MKKMRFLFVAVMAGLMCIACTPKKEKLLRSYEDACQRGDATAVLRVVSEMEKEFGDKDEHEVFTETELARFEAASAIFEQKMAEQAMQQLNGAMQQMNNMGVNPWGNDDDEDEDEDED